MASRKQKAAARRNIKKAQAALRRKRTPKRRSSSKRRKTNKPRRRSRSMPTKRRRSSGGRKSSGFINRIPILKNKTVQKIGFGLGMGSIATIAAGAIPVPAVQANKQLIGTGVTFATDPLAGVVRLALTGGLGQLGNLFGGGGQSNGGGGGFA